MVQELKNKTKIILNNIIIRIKDRKRIMKSMRIINNKNKL